MTRLLALLRSQSTKALVIVCAASLVGSLAFYAWMASAGSALQPRTIVSLELAFTPAAAGEILDGWGDLGRKAAERSLLIDFGYIFFGYSPLLATLGLLVARRPAQAARRSRGEWIAFGVLVAGLLDVVENLALLQVVRGPTPPFALYTWTAGIAAVAKFALVGAAGVYVLGPVVRATRLARWFWSYPILALVAALVLGILWRVTLPSFGIPDLFWDEYRSMQFLAGAGVGILLGHLGAMGFLLETHRLLEDDPEERPAWMSALPVRWAKRFLPAGPEALQETPTLLTSYLLRTSLPLAGLALLSAIRASGAVSPWWLPIGLLLSFAVYLVGAALLSARHMSGKFVAKPVRRQIQAVEPEFQNLHTFAYWALIGQIGIYAFMWLLWFLGWEVSAALAACILLGGLASAYGFLKYSFDDRTFGVLAIAFVVYVALNALPGHQLPGLDYAHRVPLNQDTRALPQDQQRAERPPQSGPSGQYLNEWKSARGGRAAPLIVVAVDGGGIRAAVWASVVMARLERDLPQFPHHVRVVTGASGGMVGMAAYVGSLQRPGGASAHRDLEGKALSAEDVTERVARESLGHVARALVFKDLLPPFLHPTSDRGTALEAAWEANTGVLGQAFSALAAGEQEGWRPSLIVSPLIVEDGRRLLISNMDVTDLATIPGTPASLQALQYFGHLEQRPGKLKLSTAVRLNASFPYVSPAAELPTKPARHTLDAGYYDEHGVELAATWIWTHREWLLENTTGVLLVQVPDKRTRELKQKAREDRRDWWGAGLLGLTGPIEALRTSAAAAADYRNDQLVRFVDVSLNAHKPGSFATVVFEPDKTTVPPPACSHPSLPHASVGLEPEERPFAEVALSWRLTTCEISRLERAFRGGDGSQSCSDRRAFEAWWNAHRPEGDPALSLRCE